MKKQNTIQKIAKTQKLLRKAKLVLTVMAVTIKILKMSLARTEKYIVMNQISLL